ncbi:MAG: hypothetical protein HQ453_12685 [Actinobacteria bacterium]|nr:hypothetical protein [Actinomycetota bacterium]
MPQVKTVEAKIVHLEGFTVKILNADGADVRSDRQLPAQFDQHTNRAAGSMTVAGWKRVRFSPQFPGFSVAVLLGNGTRASGGKQLATVRNSYK